MPINSYDTDGGLGCISVGEGIVTTQEYLDSTSTHLTKPKATLSRYIYSMSDYSKIEKLEVKNREIISIAQRCRELATVHQGILVAIVTKSDLIYGLSRMWDSLTDTKDWELKLHYNRQSADDWLRARVLEKHGIEALKFMSTPAEY